MDLHQPAEPTRCAIGFAGIGVSLECTETAVISAICKSYAPFVFSGKTQFKGFITTASPFDRVSEVELEFKDEVLCFQTPHSFGEINWVAGIGQCWVPAAQSLAGVEYFLRLIFILLAHQRGGFMLHGAGVVHHGKGHVFVGRSGSGKTTVAQLSLPDVVLNDDLVLLLPAADQWEVYGTPFWSPGQVKPSPGSAPLVGLFRLVQDLEVKLEKASFSQAVAELLACVPVLPLNSSFNRELMNRCERLIERTPLHYLHFLPDNSFWEKIDCLIWR